MLMVQTINVDDISHMSSLESLEPEMRIVSG